MNVLSCCFNINDLFWCDRDFVPVGSKGVFGNSLHEVYVRVFEDPFTYSGLLVGKL